MNERWNNLVIVFMAIPVFVIMVNHVVKTIPVDWAVVYMVMVILVVVGVHIRHNVIKVKSKE
jgi:hypothetical protein